jgi:hypothetical protein
VGAHGYGDPAARVLGRLAEVRPRGAGWTARCPVADCPYRLSVDVGGDGRVLLYCAGGCGARSVAAALGLAVRDLFPRRPAEGGDPR